MRAAGFGVEAAVIALNAVWSTLGLSGLLGCARLLAHDRREQGLIALLALTAFGTAQVAIGYVDVYPVALAAGGIFFWSALRALRGEAHPAWAVAIAAAAPFFYAGALLLWAPAFVLLVLVARGSGDGMRRALWAAGAGVLSAGVATIPQRGRPFDWPLVVRLAAEGSAYQAGYLPDSSLLPLWYLTSARHLGEVASTILLVDPVGAALLAIAGGALLERGGSALDGASALLGAFVAGWIAYLLTMDAVFGAFADWDLFASGALGTSLLGGYAFVRWARSRSERSTGALAGLALAVALAHLLARLHALPVGAERHVVESPLHVPAQAGAPAR
jgi:hypothetical protein